MRQIILALFLAAQCSADTIRITLSGTLEQWINREVYGPIIDPTFRITLYIDEHAVDQDPNPQRGVYVSDDLPIVFEFGQFRSFQFGAMVKVYAGADGLFGFIFQNASPFVAFGVYHPAEWSYYAFYLQPFSASVAPTDALHWVVDTQDNVFHTYNRHAYMDGFKWWRHAWQQVHGEADNDITVYSAEIL